MTDTLTALDATFLELEQLDEGALMHIGGVMVFDPLPRGGVPIVEEVQAQLASRLAFMPRYSQRLSSTRTRGFAWPRWVDDERFDIRDHVRHAALPSPGGEDELLEWAADFYSHRLDRTRPLWEIVLVEGLEHGRWALAHKTHHCLVDGVGSVDVAQVLLDTEPNPRKCSTIATTAHEDASAFRSMLPDPPQAIAQAAHAGVHAAQAGLHAALHPREALSRSRSVAEMLLRDEVIGAPHTSLNVPIGSSRRFAVVRASLGQLKAASRGLGGTVNDLVLAACTTGLRRLILERGEPLPRRGLRAMIPMNVRAASERLALGNRVSSLFVELPVAEPAVHARLQQIVATTKRLKSSHAADDATAIIDLAALAPPVVHAALARSLYATRLFNVTITNVPGPQMPLYTFGAPLRELHPLVPLAAEHAVGIAIFSYNGLLNFGLSADRESTPDLEVLRDGIEEGIAELLALVPSRPPRASSRSVVFVPD